MSEVGYVCLYTPLRPTQSTLTAIQLGDKKKIAAWSQLWDRASEEPPSGEKTRFIRIGSSRHRFWKFCGSAPHRFFYYKGISDAEVAQVDTAIAFFNAHVARLQSVKNATHIVDLSRARFLAVCTHPMETVCDEAIEEDGGEEEDEAVEDEKGERFGIRRRDNDNDEDGEPFEVDYRESDDDAPTRRASEEDNEEPNPKKSRGKKKKIVKKKTEEDEKGFWGVPKYLDGPITKEDEDSEEERALHEFLGQLKGPKRAGAKRKRVVKKYKGFVEVSEMVDGKTTSIQNFF